MAERMATFQGRLILSLEENAFLADYADRYGRVERTLYADMRRTGLKAAAFKNAYLVRFGMTARQFNAISRNLEGKIASVLERLPQLRSELEQRIARAEKVLAKIRDPFKRHQKQRRLAILRSRLSSLDEQLAAKDPGICFGSKKLFRAQFALTANGYADHDEWKADWRTKRAGQFFVVGSKDETAGCVGCVLGVQLDGSFTLRLRSFSREARYLTLPVRIPYGQDVLREALRRGRAISYRFYRDDKGWRVFATTAQIEGERRSIKTAGALGVDVNADCLAVSEIDRHGNLVGTAIVPLVTYGKTTSQAKAAVGEAVKTVIAWAERVNKPLVVEKLDFGKKKAALEAEHPRQARMLSSLAYSAVLNGLQARAFRAGIEVISVNPAYTSFIGLVNHAKRQGLSVHQAAALVIARRGCGFREHPSGEAACVPTPQGDHVTFSLPARNRGKHVWSFWARARNIHKAVLAAHLRPSREEPSSPRPAKRNGPVFTVRPRDANHRQNCSVGVLGDLPW